MPSRSGNRPPLTREVQVSKKLSWLLRHGAEKENLSLDPRGYAKVSDVLANRNLRSFKVTFAELQQIVLENDKQRFSLIPAQSSDKSEEDAPSQLTTSSKAEDWLIRANQGHSLKIESSDLLTPITLSDLPVTAIHGTTHAKWPLILASGGLKPMGRTHVHFASGLPTGFKPVTDADQTQAQIQTVDGNSAGPAVTAPVISGMRNSSTVLIYVDVERAMQAGVKFWRSENGVVLSEGDAEGVVKVEFFKRVEDRTGEGVLVEDGRVVKEAPKHWGAGKKGSAPG